MPIRSNIDFIESIEISDALFLYLKNNNMIMYSTDMAYLYNLSNKDRYDKYYQTRAFKHIKDKEKILSKQRNGC